ASFALGFGGGTVGVAVSGAGAVALNSVTSRANAHIDDSTVSSATIIDLDAASTKAITATIAALSAAASGGGTAGVGVSIGLAIAKNLIGETLDGGSSPTQTQAYVLRSALTAGGALTLLATASHTISALVVSASAAVAGGGTAGVGVSGAGVWAENRVAAHVKSYLDGDGATGISVASAELAARDTSSISAIVGAASLAFAFGGTAGVAVSVAVSLAKNVIANQVEASIANADSFTTTSGGLTLEAVEDASILAVSAAASVAVGAGTFGGGVAGAGAWARNEITTTTTAAISGSTITSGGDVSLSASDTSAITALIAAVAIGAGAGAAGLGVAIGGSVAENVIGTLTSASILNSDVFFTVTTADLALTATTDQRIDALVMAGSMAVAVGDGGAVGASGAAATNSISARTAAFLDGCNVGTDAIPVASITIKAIDTSLINAITGAASIAASFAPNVGVAISIGVALAWNRIDNNVAAYVANTAATIAAGDVLISAMESAMIKAWTAAASLSVAVSTVAVGVSGAGAQATNIILSKVNAYVDGGSLTSDGDITISATNTATIEAKVLAVAAAAAVGAGGVGAALGVSVARNFIGWDPSSLTATHLSSATPETVSNDETVEIVTGARTGDFYQYVGTDPLVNEGGSPLDLSIQEYGDATWWQLVGAYDRAQVRAYSSGTDIDATGALTLTATATQKIDAIVATGAVALGGGAAGVAISGAGVYAANRIATDVKATIEGVAEVVTVKASSISLTASDDSTISALAGAAAIAGAVGGVAGAITIGLAIATNQVVDDVVASIAKAAVTSGDITIKASSAGGGGAT
ncbi:MAG: hypothetical protein WCF12_07420, partial [Propionicimonas sp.]